MRRKYQWGGYTKLTATGTTLNIDRGDGILYSKFVNRNWTFDANATGSITHNDNYNSYNVETFRDVYVGDRHFDAVTRTSQSGADYLRQSNSQSATFRAAYETEDIEIIHSVSYNRTATPMERNLSSVSYSQDFGLCPILTYAPGFRLVPDIPLSDAWRPGPGFLHLPSRQTIRLNF